MAEPAKNGILEYLESVRSDNPETFTEHQTGIGRKGFRKYIPDPTQVADYLNFPQKNGIRTLTPDVPIKVDPSNKYYNPNTEYFAGEDGQYYSTTSGGTRLYHQPDGSLAAFPKGRGVGDYLDEMGSELSYLNSEQFLKDNPEAEYSPIALGGKAYRAIQNMPEHDEEAFMDEYYGEYPERSADTALGILSAFPAVSGARLGKAVHGMIKNPAKFSRLSKAEQNKLDWLSVKPVLQLLGLFGATLDTGLEKRGRREKEAKEMGIPFSEHPEFQKKANGGEIDPYSMLDPNPDLSTIPETPKLDAIAKFFLPVTDEGELSKSGLAFEAATMFPMLFWMKGLKYGSQGYKQAAKIQDEIEDLKDVVVRENKNKPYDGTPATNAAFRVQKEIGRKENDLLRLVREQDPKYADLVEEASRRRIAQAKLEADPLYKTKLKSGIIKAIDQGGDDVFDLAGNPRANYQAIMEEGYKANRDLAKGVGSLIKKSATPPLTETGKKVTRSKMWEDLTKSQKDLTKSQLDLLNKLSKKFE